MVNVNVNVVDGGELESKKVLGLLNILRRNKYQVAPHNPFADFCSLLFLSLKQCLPLTRIGSG